MKAQGTFMAAAMHPPRSANVTLVLSQWWHHDTACWQGYFAEQDEGTTPQAPPDPDQVEEKIAFALGDGRVGVLAVKGRKVLLAFIHTLCLASLCTHVGVPAAKAGDCSCVHRCSHGKCPCTVFISSANSG